MYKDKSTALILPAKNEEAAVLQVLKSVPREIDRIVVVDNGSTDRTPLIAGSLGAVVVAEPTPGYGMACLAGLKYLMEDPPDIVVFADADGSDCLSRVFDLISPIVKRNADFVLEVREPLDCGALRVPA